MRHSENKPSNASSIGRNKRHKRGGTVQLACAVLLVIVGAGLLIAGFMVPPIGEIHPTVLVGFGETLTFVGALFGIDYHYKYNFKKHN